MSDLAETYREMNRISRLIRHLGISLELLSGRTIYTFRSEATQAPASTTRLAAASRASKATWYGFKKPRAIYDVAFNPKYLPDTSASHLVIWLGTAWHELGHLLWSPYGDHISVTLGLNLLEDARCEYLLLRRFPLVRGALMATLGYLMNRVSAEGTRGNMVYQYAWLAGRMHIDVSIRAGQRALIDPDTADQIDRIFKEYLALGSRPNTAMALHLRDELDEILNDNDDDSTNQNHSVCTGIGIGEVDDPTPLEGADPIDTSGIDEAAKQSGSLSRPADHDEQASRNAEILKDLENQVKEEMAQDSDLQAELTDMKEILGGKGAGGSRRSRGGDETIAPTPIATELANKVRRIATKFDDTTGKGIVRRRDTGRLRPQRLDIYDDLDTAFDSWEPGLDQEMFIGLCIDASGSMDHAPLNEIVYALEVGLDDVADLDIVYFNNEHFNTAEPNTPYRMNRVRAEGNTDPTSAMLYLWDAMKASSAANKMVVLYTDGVFNSTQVHEAVRGLVKEMMNIGVTVYGIGEGSGGSSSITRLSDAIPSRNVRKVIDISELPDIVLEWTKGVLIQH